MMTNSDYVKGVIDRLLVRIAVGKKCYTIVEYSDSSQYYDYTAGGTHNPDGMAGDAETVFYGLFVMSPKYWNNAVPGNGSDWGVQGKLVLGAATEGASLVFEGRPSQLIIAATGIQNGFVAPFSWPEVAFNHVSIDTDANEASSPRWYFVGYKITLGAV